MLSNLPHETTYMPLDVTRKARRINEYLFWTIHSMGLCHSRDNLSNKRAGPMYSRKKMGVWDVGPFASTGD